MSSAGRTNLRTIFFEYSVNDIAVRRESGKEMHIAMNVTANVPEIKGKKPNFFCEGFQSDDVTRSQNEFS